MLQHKNQIVNEELWNEAQTYGDVQLMPFVDYYSLLTWKTLAICIFGVNKTLFFSSKFDHHILPFVASRLPKLKCLTLTISYFQQTEVVAAKYVMKTDDDALVRIDEVLQSLNKITLTDGLIYGLIELDSQPDRNPDSKWFISEQV